MPTQLDSADGEIVSTALPYCEAGFALHWLRVRSKAPIAEGWSSAPVASAEQLREAYRDGYNIGVRLGEPSVVAGGYLHAFDIDIRDPDQVQEAWDALREMLGDIDPETLPSVVSGSGGESRHLYFVSDKSFYSRKLAVSEGKIRRYDPSRGKDIWSFEWEIELFGTGKQVVMPPSIHPETGAEYAWERLFDLDALALGLAPTIPADRLTEIADPLISTYEFEKIEPLAFKPGQLERELDEVSVSDLHYDDWAALGMALHHQFGGSEEGWNLWLKHTRRSVKYDGDDRTMRNKWRSFGRNRRRPVTMATVRQWVLDARRDAFVDAFDDMGDLQSDQEQPETRTNADVKGDSLPDELAELIGGGTIEERDPLDVVPDDAIDDDDPLDAPVKLEWPSLLDFNESGAIRPTLHNVRLIVENDLRTKGVPQVNLFTQETVQRQPVGMQSTSRKNTAKPTLQLTSDIWQVEDPVNGACWTTQRDNDVRRIIEAPRTQGGYGLKVSDRDLRGAIELVARSNSFHPVREYLETHKWDGTSRVENLFIDHLKADDTPYNRDIARLLLIGAVTRIYEPGAKFDFAVIIEGPQGRGKSSFIRALAKNWFAELEGNFGDTKQMVEIMQGAWILEIPELSAFNRSDVRAIKSFISRQVDRVRLPYAARASSFPRQCIFVGSTNDAQYLKDDTGGRRFWPVQCEKSFIDLPRLKSDIDQIWAEAFHLYRELRSTHPQGTLPLYLVDQRSRETAQWLQQSRSVESPEVVMAGVVSAWLEKPISTGCLSNDDGQQRQVTCAIEIWRDCLGEEASLYRQGTAQMIGRAMELVPGWQKGGHADFVKFGKQRSFRRIPGWKPELEISASYNVKYAP